MRRKYVKKPEKSGKIREFKKKMTLGLAEGFLTLVSFWPTEGGVAESAQGWVTPGCDAPC